MTARRKCGAERGGREGPPLWAALVAVACSKPWSPSEYSEAALVANVGRGFALGAATAAHQIEGGNDNDWSAWEAGAFSSGRAHVKGGDRSGLACDSWNLWERDVGVLRELGLRHYRMSIEWSRLVPVRGGWDEAAAARYRQMFALMRQSGIAPAVTLHHFTLPRWFAERGGWEHPEAVADFADYVARAADQFGDQVDRWITINEPNVYAVLGYMDGKWPPGVQDARRGARVLATLLRAHAEAYATLKARDTRDADGDGVSSEVGIAHHARVFQPGSINPLDHLVAHASDEFFNQAVPEAIATGRIRISVPGTIDIDETYPGLTGAWDFFGLNSYTRDHMRVDLGTPSLSQTYVPDGKPTTDLGWEIYPEGLLELLRRYARYQRPIVILENGIADRSDLQRADYIRLHLLAITRAAREGIPVTGYYHWSLMDNFEWAEGYSGRFGLYAVDFDDPARRRTARDSASVIRSLAGALAGRAASATDE